MTRFFYAVVGYVVVCGAVARAADERHVDRSGAFSYVLPTGWTIAQRNKGAHEIVMLPVDGPASRNVIFSDQPGESTLAELREKYERDLAQLKNFQLLKSELIDLPSGRPAVRIIHTNTQPGIAVRQINYILDVGPNRYFINATVLSVDFAKYDEAVAVLVDSLRAETPAAPDDETN